MLLLTNYDSSKTLNENKDIIFEQNDVNNLVKNFKNAQVFGTNSVRINGLIIILRDKLPNNINSFINFYNGVKTQTNKSLGRHINELLSNSDSEKAIEIANILKSKFGITVKSNGVQGNYFRKNFQFPDVTDKTSWGLVTKPASDPNKKDSTTSNDANPNKVISYNPDGSEVYANTASPAPATPPAPAPAAVPQKFDDVLNGKGLLKLGSKSPAVGELQQKLIKLGYTTIVKPTNYYGNLTKNAVLDFQTKQKLGSLDGIVGPETANRIKQMVDIKQRRASSTNQPVPTASRPLPTGGGITPPAVSGIQTR